MEEPRRLGGRYELSGVLGRGGMAEVYLAHDTRLGRTVAVKTLRTDLARDPSCRARFRREAQSAASLNHPAIVAVYDTDEADVDAVPLPYIVMEHVEGSTLRELLHSQRQLPPGQALETTVGILQGLEYAHRNGIVHRDIKPANVMLTRDGQVKVMDFGIARAMDDSGITLTETSVVVGTVQYLSPEQAKGEKVDARSDLYSTGCVLYELLTASPPFAGASPVTVTYHHVHEEPKPPSALNPEITPEMDAIVLRALLKDPHHRYQSADDMRADIEACLRNRSGAATTALAVVAADRTRPPQPRTDAAEPTVTLPPVKPDTGGHHANGHGSGDRPDHPEGGNRPQRTSRTGVVIAAILMAALLALSVVIINRWMIDDGDGGGPAAGAGGGGIVAGEDAVAMPDFVGETRAEAERLAREQGLRLAFQQGPCAHQSEGRICEQNPATGTQVAKGSTVTVVASVGRAESSAGAPRSKVTVPRVTGLSAEDARATLEADRYAFHVKTRTQQSRQEPGTVLKQDPAAGTEVEKGTAITLVVAGKPGKPGEHGPEQGDTMATVPEVTGLTCDAAKARMTAYALVGNCTEQATDDPGQAGKAISTTPRAGRQVKRNSTVTIVIGKAGQKEELVLVPDIDGESLSTARVLLREAGLTVGDISGSEHPLARVVFSAPSDGTRVERGTAVDLVTVGPSSKDD
ncbi:Stk1 family PASTA domain-containing Ser/Thr kinase [Streptomyces sp. NPDC007984]|uniref:Stk1 family PASTA domain-containing Ser/Thr kinase n=1 Tax=Streptomyces sp. NPDC007984 TaxID=3364801 RepID=UPI0036E68368